MKVIFLGSGNLATRLSLEMHRKGIRIGQVYSHTPENAQQLAALLGCPGQPILKLSRRMPTCMSFP